MSRPQFELAGVIRKFGPRFAEKYRPNAYHQRILHALSVCRTSALGGHKEACDCCGQIRICYNSCRNRHCPKCQTSKQAAWVEDLLETTLPVKHYHLVFTVPHELNQVCLSDSQWFYGRLFSSVSVLQTRNHAPHRRTATGALAIRFLCLEHCLEVVSLCHPILTCPCWADGEAIAQTKRKPAKTQHPLRTKAIKEEQNEKTSRPGS